MIDRSAGESPFSSVDAPCIALEIRSGYATARADVPDGLPLCVIHIDMAQTTVATGTGPVPAGVIILEIGSQKTSSEYFKHDPPTAGELENAIMLVEDEVTRARSLTAGHPMLFTFDTAILDIARISGASSSGNLNVPLDAIERTFDRFARVTMGSTPAHQGIPAGPEFAATLLIVREFMHHLQFDSITIKTQAVA